MKYCPSCKKGKELNEFYNCHSLSDGKTNICKSCSKARSKKYRSTEKGKIKKREREKLPQYRQAKKLCSERWRKTEKYREGLRRIRTSERYKERQRKWRESPKGIESCKMQGKKYRKSKAYKARRKRYEGTEKFKEHKKIRHKRWLLNHPESREQQRKRDQMRWMIITRELPLDYVKRYLKKLLKMRLGKGVEFLNLDTLAQEEKEVILINRTLKNLRKEINYGQIEL